MTNDAFTKEFSCARDNRVFITKVPSRAREVKNAKITMTGKNSIFKELDEAKKNRDAHYAIGAVHESKIPDVCGCFRIYPSNNIVCSVSQDEDPLALEIAYKVARTELVLSALRE